jgi:hypothetical protein
VENGEEGIIPLFHMPHCIPGFNHHLAKHFAADDEDLLAPGGHSHVLQPLLHDPFRRCPLENPQVLIYSGASMADCGQSISRTVVVPGTSAMALMRLNGSFGSIVSRFECADKVEKI